MSEPFVPLPRGSQALGTRLASVIREFYKEIDRENRIFGRKTDILTKFLAECAILLNIYGKKD